MRYRSWGPRRQLTISLSPQAYDRLERTARREEKSKSLLLEELVLTTLNTYNQVK